jgi:ribosomal protein S12 methylthiotransferase
MCIFEIAVDGSTMKRPPRVAFVSLGCAKNLVDSEKMLGLLAEGGCEFTSDPQDADAIVINTCGFLDASRAEAHQAIAEAAAHKNSRRRPRVVVAGCLVQRDGSRLLQDVAGIDALVGVNNREDIVKAVLGRRPERPDLYLGDYYWRQDNDRSRLRLTPTHFAYLRISEGCNQSCTFCTIPSIRGPMHCKSAEQIVAEARELVADGAVEINLIGQDTTSYGADINYQPGLSGLLRELNRVDGLGWIRLMYVYPSDFTDEMIQAIADCEKVVKYIDIPLQHINDRILKAMHRRVTRLQTVTLLERIRRMIPGVALRTTMITGFPGETDAEFEELLEFVEDVRFDALGVFPYSQEPGTPAGRMRDQIPNEVKQARADELMNVQQEVAFELAEQRVGQVFTVLIDGPPAEGAQPSRHGGQAPEVDSMTLVRGARYQPGELVEVRCTATRDYDLIAMPTRVLLPVLS